MSPHVILSYSDGIKATTVTRPSCELNPTLDRQSHFLLQISDQLIQTASGLLQVLLLPVSLSLQGPPHPEPLPRRSISHHARRHGCKDLFGQLSSAALLSQ